MLFVISCFCVFCLSAICVFFVDFVCVCFEGRKMQFEENNYDNFHSEKGPMLSEQYLFMLPTLSTAHAVSHLQSRCWCPRGRFLGKTVG